MENIDKALDILEENVVSIRNVSEWAFLMGYSNNQYFCRKIKTHFLKAPNKIIKEKKLNLIRLLLKKHPEKIFFFIAIEAGFANAQSLSKFVKRATGKTLTTLKRSVKTECENGV